MATKPPVPALVERDCVRPPNQPGAAGSRAANGYLPLARVSCDMQPPNRGPGGDRRGGSANLAAQAGEIHPPNHQFDVGMAKMPQPPSAQAPGQGDVPVHPFGSGFPGSQMRRGK